jgi:hypothetical protein
LAASVVVLLRMAQVLLRMAQVLLRAEPHNFRRTSRLVLQEYHIVHICSHPCVFTSLGKDDDMSF